MLNIFYTNAVSLHIKMHEIHAKATNPARDNIAASKTLGSRALMDA